MIFQAYLDTTKTRTGKAPDDFRKLATENGQIIWHLLVFNITPIFCSGEAGFQYR